MAVKVEYIEVKDVLEKDVYITSAAAPDSFGEFIKFLQYCKEYNVGFVISKFADVADEYKEAGYSVDDFEVEIGLNNMILIKVYLA